MIPNAELTHVFQSEILNRFCADSGDVSDLYMMMNHLLSGQVESFSEELQTYIEQLVSVYDAANKESFYHGLVLGMTALVLNDYYVESNRESGYGRFDIAIFPRKPNLPGVIIEFKVAPTENDLQEKSMEITKAGIAKNITNLVGVHLLKNNYYYLEVDELDPLMPQIPAEFANDEVIIKIKGNVEKMKATAVGQKFTDFEMATPDGKPVKLSDYVGKGKVVLIDFWASWCGPCRREMPNLVEAYAQYKNKGFEIVGVSLDQSGEAWKDAIEKLNITWPQMSDLKYWNSEGAQLYAVSSIPHTVLIDGEGTIIARGLHGEELQTKLAEVLK